MNFTGDLKKLVECSTAAVGLIRSGDYTSKPLHDHLACAYGEANALRPDPAEPVFFSASPPATVEEACDQLEQALPGLHEGQIVAEGPVDWLTVFQLVVQLVELLKKK